MPGKTKATDVSDDEAKFVFNGTVQKLLKR